MPDIVKVNISHVVCTGCAALKARVGEKAFVAGQVTFDGKAEYHHLDVPLVKLYGNKGITFAFVRETRH